MSKQDDKDKELFNNSFKPSSRTGNTGVFDRKLYEQSNPSVKSSTVKMPSTDKKVATSNVATKARVTPNREEVKKKPKENSKEARVKRLRSLQLSLEVFGELLKIALIIIVTFVIVAGGAFVGLWMSVNNGAGALAKEDFEINNFTTTIYDIYGKEYTTLSGAENRTYASLDQISEYLPDAFISIEDERFYLHKGVDIKRTGAATFKYILSKFGIGSAEYGGSTITQQVIKKVTGEDDHSSLRKAKEIIRAFQLEKWLSKSDIIELYMNLIYLGEGSYGVEAASYTYFAKSSKDLTIAESALIAGLAQAPEGYNPYNHPDKAKNRQKLVLGKMYELGKITREEYDAALEEELVYKKGNLNLASSNSYFVDAVVEACIKDLMEEKSINRAMAQKMVYNNGLHIYTTLDPKIQNVLETKYMDQSYFKTRKGYDENLQSAMVIIDYHTGNVVGLIGGAGEKTTLRGLNRATGMTRSIGSNMKPIGVYGPGLEKGTLTAATTFDDVPTTYKVLGKAWSVKNYTRTYRGLMNVRKAIEISNNVVAAKALQEKVGTDYSYHFLEQLGISSLTSADKASPAALSLGGMTKGISPLELCAAYGTIANGGVYIEPKLYTRIEDRNGQLVYKKRSTVRDVMSPENAYILTDMMHTVVVGSEGTGANARIRSGIDVAAKTGTTSDDKDRWFSAFTPYYVGSVWFGYDTPEYINVATNPGTKVWHDVMAEIHKDLPDAKFEQPAGVKSYTVCRDSGLLATDACRADKRGNREISAIFNTKNGTVPKTFCDLHEFVEVCPESFDKPNPVCIQESGTVKISRLNKHYKGNLPSVRPDAAYEVPTKFCTYHYCPTDANGNYITPTPTTTTTPANGSESTKPSQSTSTSQSNNTGTSQSETNAPTSYWWER